MTKTNTTKTVARKPSQIVGFEREKLDELMEMLSFARPENNAYEAAFIDRYLRPLGVHEDQYGNLWKDVGPDTPIVLWSSHTDTVHDRGGLQHVVFDYQTDTIRLGAIDTNKRYNCLGADCTTGVWLMMNMIRANVPGRYVFHRAEERGGKGSAWIRDNNPQMLDGIRAAIAFDRKGSDEIIIEQGADICASRAFAESLGAALNGGFKPSTFGSFTDTKNYRKLVDECVNVAVGYENAHTNREIQRWSTAYQLLCDLITDFDQSVLVYERDKNVADPPRYYGGSYNQGRRYSLPEIKGTAYPTVAGGTVNSNTPFSGLSDRQKFARLMNLYREELIDMWQELKVDPDVLHTKLAARWERYNTQHDVIGH